MTPSSPKSLAGRRVLLIVGGGIAAYKALDLIRRLRERGAQVRPLLTESAQEFVTPLAAAARRKLIAQGEKFAAELRAARAWEAAHAAAPARVATGQ